MKRAVTMFLAIVLICGLAAAQAAFAENFPATNQGPPQLQQGPGPHNMPQRFYGYVPSPPIRHVWPGGYRVIIQDINNVLADHLLGYY